MADSGGSSAHATSKAKLSTFRSPPPHNEVLRVYDKAFLEQGIEGGEDIKPPEIAEKEQPPKNPSKPVFRNPKDVKMASNKVKMADAEERRKEDQKDIREQVGKLKQMREQRFERMSDSIMDNAKLVMEAAGVLRSKESDDLRRKSSLHNTWSSDIYQPIADQLHSHLNPFNRTMRQDLRGVKSVDFRPKRDFTVTYNFTTKDPMKRNLYNAAEEDFFHRTARTVLGKNAHSRSCPDFNRTAPSWSSMASQWSPVQGTGTSSSGSNLRPSELPSNLTESASDLFSPNQVKIPRGRCKPTIEPDSTGQMALQDTLYGHFAQICEEGPGFKRLVRGGDNVFIPDEKDGISTAGKIRTLWHGFNDVGILKGEECSRGESSRYKTKAGSSSGAPSQDHFSFDTSTFATTVEFPLGKKMYAHMH